jgi:hypothetical protein
MRFVLQLVTHRHDWPGRRITRVLTHLRRTGWVGDPVWWSRGLRRRPIVPPGRRAFAREVLALFPSPLSDQVDIRVGGATPAAWELTLWLAPFDHDAGEVGGLSMLVLAAERSDVSRLAEELDELVELVGCESACVHEEASHRRLMHDYGRWPVHSSIFLPGLFGCTYASARILREIDRTRLGRVRGHRVEWRPDGSLFFVSTARPGDAASARGEASLRATTRQFLEASTDDRSKTLRGRALRSWKR